MKIAYIYDVIYPYVKGGAEKRFWELARRLSAKGHEVHIFGMQSWEGKANFIKEGVHIHGVCRHNKLYTKTGVRSIKQVLCFTAGILASLWRNKFDIIDCNAFPYLPFFPVRLFSLFKATPLVVTWQEVWGGYWYKYLGYTKGITARFIEKAVIKLSDNIIAHSVKVKSDLILCGAKDKNIEVIPNGIELEAINQVPEKQKDTDLIFVGRLIKEKNVDILIKAVYLLKKELGRIKCVIVGQGPQSDALMDLAEKLGLKEDIVFTGFLEHEEIISNMKAARVFVLPSRREGFGIVVVEAMACGLPVIVVNSPMNASVELIKSGSNGFVCSPDEDDISRKALVLLKDVSLRNNMSSFARDSAKGYDWGRAADRNEALYMSIINKGKIIR